MHILSILCLKDYNKLVKDGIVVYWLHVAAISSVYKLDAYLRVPPYEPIQFWRLCWDNPSADSEYEIVNNISWIQWNLHNTTPLGNGNYVGSFRRNFNVYQHSSQNFMSDYRGVLDYSGVGLRRFHCIVVKKLIPQISNTISYFQKRLVCGYVVPITHIARTSESR